jgi:uncharacterized repeat protein (TIGR01451 family)
MTAGQLPMVNRSKRSSVRRVGMVGLVVLSTLALVALGASVASSKPNPGGVSGQDVQISSAGPLTNIFISTQLNCQVDHVGDTDHEFFGGVPGACATELATGGTTYGPSSIPAGNDPGGFTPVSQTPVTGDGSAGNPFTVVTVVNVAATGLVITETDSYVIGQESYRTDVAVHNGNASGTIPFVLYRGGDCFLQNSDDGFGDLDLTTGQVGCRGSDDGGVTPNSRVERWIPITAGSAAIEAGFGTVWNGMSSGNPFPNTCLCSSFIDNGAGLSWNGSLDAGQSATFSHLTVFSPTGAVSPAIVKTAQLDSVPAGGVDSYTITVNNPGGPITLNSLTDHLPDGFTYVPGSTTGATTADPTVSGHDLVWAGPFNVGAGGSITLGFAVIVGSTPGTFTNSVDADGGRNPVTGTGATAPVTVVAPIVIAPTFAG